MRLLAALLVLVLALSACAQSPGCFVGVSLLPPGPVVVCGFDTELDKDEANDLDV